MVKKLILLILIFINLYAFSNTIVLKKSVFISNSVCTLQDISMNRLPEEISGIIIASSDKSSISLSSNEILNLLFSRSIYNISLVGDNILINFNLKKIVDDEQTKNKIIYKKNPLESLEEYFESFLDSNIFTIKIDPIKTDPSLNIKIIKSNFRWKLDKNYYSLNEIKKIKKLTLLFDEKEYSIFLDIKIYSNIWNSKSSFQKNDSFIEEGFIKNYVDITKFNNLDSIVFDIKKADNSTFIKAISPGETLKWDYLKKNPSVIKGESIKAILLKDRIEIILPCTALDNGYENQKIKAKLINGKEIIGILRNYNGEIYIEI